MMNLKSISLLVIFCGLCFLNGFLISGNYFISQSLLIFLACSIASFFLSDYGLTYRSKDNFVFNTGKFVVHSMLAISFGLFVFGAYEVDMRFDKGVSAMIAIAVGIFVSYFCIACNRLPNMVTRTSPLALLIIIAGAVILAQILQGVPATEYMLGFLIIGVITSGVVPFFIKHRL